MTDKTIIIFVKSFWLGNNGDRITGSTRISNKVDQLTCILLYIWISSHRLKQIKNQNDIDLQAGVGLGTPPTVFLNVNRIPMCLQSLLVLISKNILVQSRPHVINSSQSSPPSIYTYFLSAVLCSGVFQSIAEKSKRFWNQSFLQISLCKCLLQLEDTCAFTKYRINIKTQLTLMLMVLTIARRIKPEMLVQV